MSGVEGKHFWQKGVARMYGHQAAEKREVGKTFSEYGCQVFLSKEIVLGHPCIPRVRVNKGGDKRPGLRKKGRSWCEGGGQRGRDIYEAQRVNAELHVITCDLTATAPHRLVSAFPRIRITVSKSPFFM